MGDITGRPKAPASPQVVYVPQYTNPTPENTTSNTSSTSTQSSTTGSGGGDTAITPEKQREQSLLSRSRSRFGTILTGFRGILSQSNNQDSNARKTLLGE